MLILKLSGIQNKFLVMDVKNNYFNKTTFYLKTVILTLANNTIKIKVFITFIFVMNWVNNFIIYILVISSYKFA